MKDFDRDRAARAVLPAKDRSFKLGGEVFIRRAVVPAWVMGILDGLATAPPGQTLEAIDELIDEMCEEPAREKWAALRARGRDEDPLTLGDVFAVVEWLIAEETAIPTSAPSVSGDGSPTIATGAASTDVSPSPVLIQPISPSDDFSALPTPG